MPWNTFLASIVNQIQQFFNLILASLITTVLNYYRPRREVDLSMSDPIETLSGADVHLFNITLVSILSKPGFRRPALPLEIILEILSYPPFWILAHHLELTSSIDVPSSLGTKVLLRTQPFSHELLRSLRKIVFRIRSRDQGWSSYPSAHGTFENSWTWFNMAIKKGVPESKINQQTQPLETHQASTDPEPSDTSQEVSVYRIAHILQRNRHASRAAEDYRIELDARETPLKTLQLGMKWSS